MKTVIAAAIVAVGIVVLGFCIKAGLGSFLQNQRVVTVKGLAVREVKANKVIWPIVFKELGDDLPSLYNRVDAKNKIVKKFLRSSGIEDSEISTKLWSPTFKPTPIVPTSHPIATASIRL